MFVLQKIFIKNQVLWWNMMIHIQHKNQLIVWVEIEGLKLEDISTNL